MNDGTADPWGRFWIGSMAFSAEAGRGSLYRFHESSGVQTVLSNVTISNGIGWSSDLRTMYYVDSGPGTVYAFDVDEHGDVSEQRVFIQFDVVNEGTADGLCMDQEGALWLAVWGGYEVRRYSPTGEQLARVRISTAQPSCCTIGGANGTTLYITTAREDMSEEQLAKEPDAGRLFAVDVGVAGRPLLAYRPTLDPDAWKHEIDDSFKNWRKVKENTKEAPLLVAFGEAMIRLSAPERAPLRFSKELTVGVAGSELNVLVTASALGLRTRWLTRLPANELGRMIRRHATSNEVEVVASDELGARAGLFFYEFGVPPRPSNVIYDRDNSATSHVDADEFDWEAVLSDARGAHVTGITCALGKGPLEATLAFLQSAKSLGVTTSFDMNYRSQLWEIDEARSAYFAILPLVDTLFLAPSDLTLLLDQRIATDDMASTVKKQFDISTLVIRERQALSGDELSVCVRVFGDNESTAEASGVVVDEIGAGDAAAGAFLSSMLSGGSNRTSTERAARAYARMLTIPGDAWAGSLHDLTDGYVVSRTVVR